MKKLLAAAALLASSALAQSAPPAPAVTPVGIWFLCDSNPGFWMCSSYTPTAEKTYLLSIPASGPAVTNFRYTVSATVNGEPWSVSGTVDRADTFYTLAQITAPGRIESAPEITITERVDQISRGGSMRGMVR